MNLAAIRFNCSDFSTLAVRQNFATSGKLPEWVQGDTRPESSPVAYSMAAVIGKNIAIQASFTASAGGLVTVDVRADGGGVLGAIDATTITIDPSSPGFVTLRLPHHQIGASGILREDIQWDWSYKSNDGAWVPICSSRHRIYVVLDTPSLPWAQNPTTPATMTQLPWVDALELACVWAAGMRTQQDAAAAIARAVNADLGLTYDTSHGASKYTQAVSSTSWFLCTAFLAYLNKQPEGKGNIVNCTDCGTIVTTFANLLGCDLMAAVMASPGGFLCNKIIAIGGGTVWGYPFPPANRFAYHEVAWTGASSYNDNIFDACLKADSGGNPWDWMNTTSSA